MIVSLAVYNSGWSCAISTAGNSTIFAVKELLFLLNLLILIVEVLIAFRAVAEVLTLVLVVRRNVIANLPHLIAVGARTVLLTGKPIAGLLTADKAFFIAGCHIECLL